MKLRLINRANLGISRIYRALLIEGKEPPIIEELGECVRVTLLAREHSAGFRLFVAEGPKRDACPVWIICLCCNISSTTPNGHQHRRPALPALGT